LRFSNYQQYANYPETSLNFNFKMGILKLQSN
jgi:hypothetical protein